MRTPAALRWAPIVRRARQSGTSIRVFAKQNGLNERTLAWWSWRLGGDLGAPEFIEVAVADAEPVAGAPLRLAVGGVRVEVDGRSDLALLRRVVEALS